MSNHSPQHELLDGRLLVTVVQHLGEVDLNRFKIGNRRLLLVVDADELEADWLLGHIFRSALGDDRGCLERTTPTDLPALASDLADGMSTAARWLNTDGLVVELILVAPVPMNVASFALVATGLRPPQAIAEVERNIAGVEFDIDWEICTSCFEAQLHGLRVWRAAREVARRGALQ